jgi:hypothetical protein
MAAEKQAPAPEQKATSVSCRKTEATCEIVSYDDIFRTGSKSFPLFQNEVTEPEL